MITDFKSSGVVTKYLLYNGDVPLTFKEDGHRYEIEGVEVIGVTTILKSTVAKGDALMNWAVKMTADHIIENFKHGVPYSPESLLELVNEAKKSHRLAKEGAADIGTRAHKWIEQYIKSKISGGLVPGKPEEDIKEAIKSFLVWEAGNDVKWLDSERPVYSKKYNYCGTMDFIAVVNGKRVIGDIKTSNAIYPESYFLQVAAYRYAYEEEFPLEKIQGMVIIRIPKTNKSQLEVKQIDDYEGNATAFLHAKRLYEQVSKLKNYFK